MFGGLSDIFGEIFGAQAGAEGAMGLTEFLSPDARRRAESPAIVYERYLCGAPRQLNMNDR